MQNAEPLRGSARGVGRTMFNPWGWSTLGVGLDPADGVFEDHAGVVDELVLPNLDAFHLLPVLHHEPVPLGIIHDCVQHSVEDEALWRDVESRYQREEDERRELGDDVVAEHLVALCLGRCHPLALEGEVADVVTGEEHCEILPCGELGHWKPPV